MHPIHTATIHGMIDVVHHLIVKYKIDPRSADQVILLLYITCL